MDNGPDGLTCKENDWIYGQGGLNAAFKVLRPGGVLAIWSAAPDHEFITRLRRIGFLVEEIGASARGRRGGGWHTIWMAVRSLK